MNSVLLALFITVGMAILLGAQKPYRQRQVPWLSFPRQLIARASEHFIIFLGHLQTALHFRQLGCAG